MDIAVREYARMPRRFTGRERDLCLRADTNSICAKSMRRNEGKMAERVRYRTKQQELIRDCLEKHSDRFVTAEQCMDCLKAEGIHVGQTTVYRALDRLTEENAVIKIPAVDGAGAQYRYIGELRPGSPGRLVCLQCGKIIPLECNKLHGFSEHILKEHDFALDSSHLIFYGCCRECRKFRETQEGLQDRNEDE